MENDLFTAAKIKIAEKKKSYLSSLISKRQKFEYNLLKKRPKYILKATNDMKYITQLIELLKENEQIHLMSNAFDSPSILYAINKKETIQEVICSTWAITDRGLQVFQELGNKIPVYLLLDKTYSYKWVFESGANLLLKNVNFKFTENHSKAILIKTSENFYSFVGSMNLSNNPRIENIMISKDKQIFEFYERFIKREFE
jgi:hypothetical protein